MSNRNIQAELTDLANEILRVERPGICLQSDGTNIWAGRPPIFSETVVLRGISFQTGKPALKEKGSVLEIQDMIMPLGYDATESVSDDPFGRYFLEQVHEVFHAHPHQLCLHALEVHAANSRKL